MPKVDEEEVNNFANLLREEKRSHLNLSIHIKRNTAVDKVMERVCEICSSMQPP